MEAWQELRTVLHGIAALEPLFHSWYALPYRPGRNPFVDDCLRRDVERFDITLETAEPWTGQDEDWFDEAAALLRLVKFSEIHNELAMLIELGTARVNDHGHRELAGPAVVDEQAVVLARLTSGDAFDARQQ